MKTLALATTAAFALACGACHHDSTRHDDAMYHRSGSMGVVNKTCLITGEDLDDSPKVVSYKGKNYGCCCGGCIKKFNAMSDEQKAACIAAAK